MAPERIKEIYQDFTSALSRLEEALNDDLAKGSIVIDGTIQRFEFTFELAWKLKRAILNYRGIEANTPRDVIKEGYRTYLISDGDGWISMLDDRNMTAHIYDETKALEIYKKIKDNHLKLLLELVKKAGEFLKNE